VTLLAESEGDARRDRANCNGAVPFLLTGFEGPKRDQA
jgi:hypothetical protein